jgi:hypothetical protein
VACEIKGMCARDRRLGIAVLASLLSLLLLVLFSSVVLAHEDSITAVPRPGVPDPELDEAQSLTRQVRQDLA